MSKPAETWLLPDGVQDVLPAEAHRLEGLRRQVLDLFAVWGYELVFTPLMEYLDSLLTGSGHDLDLMTFKITDQLSGRLMGVRADITPQVARLDAHSIPVERPARYCYAGTTLNTRPAGLAASRCPVQIGAELYGHDGVESDIEILRLMLDALALAGCRNIHLDLGHVGIFRALSGAAGLAAADEARLFDVYQRKAQAELEAELPALVADERLRHAFLALVRLSGDWQVLIEARQAFSGIPGVGPALNALDAVAGALSASHPQVTLYFDLSELRGYHYHTGLVFAAYVSGTRQEVAKGGRYDHVGEAFGRARPATGFSADLKALLQFYTAGTKPSVIFAPGGYDPGLRDTIANLRRLGERVIQALPGQQGDAAAMGCERELVQENGLWVVRAL
jgi:ATP phosphoribosyltransferase regulatory subunit